MLLVHKNPREKFNSLHSSRKTPDKDVLDQYVV